MQALQGLYAQDTQLNIPGGLPGPAAAAAGPGTELAATAAAAAAAAAGGVSEPAAKRRRGLACAKQPQQRVLRSNANS